MAESLRTFRRASGRCPRRGGNFGNAARGSAAHRDKSPGDSLMGASCANDPLSPHRRDQSAPLRTRNTRSSWLARIGMRFRCAASVCGGLLLPVYYCLAGGFPDRAGNAEKLESTCSGRGIRFYLRRVPVSPIILSLSTDAGDSSDGRSKR